MLTCDKEWVKEKSPSPSRTIIVITRPDSMREREMKISASSETH